DHFLHMAQYEVDDEALEAKKLADRRHDHIAYVRPRHDLLQRMREVFDDDDDFGARVAELMLELARRVERIDVDDGATRTQHAEQAGGILQNVRHHQRDARAFLAAGALQISAKRGGQRVELGERERFTHARERRARRELAAAFLEHLAYRRVFVHVDLRGNPLRIAAKPDFFHALPFFASGVIPRR